MERRGKVGKWSTILKVIDEAIPEVDACCPFLMQEPLLEPRLIAILDNIKQVNRHCKTTVFTNMAAMTEKLAEKIVKSRLLDHLVISFYGPTERLYRLLQPPLNWKQTKKRIRRFIRIRNSHDMRKPVVRMHYIAIPQLLKHFTKFKEEWQNVVDAIGFVHYDNFHGDMPSLAEKHEEAVWGPPETARSPCPRLWSGLNVLYDGTVVPCCIDYNGTQPMGNIHHKSLHEIWLDEPFQRFRRAHVNRDMDALPLCRNCTLWKYQHPKEWNLYWTCGTESSQTICQKR